MRIEKEQDIEFMKKTANRLFSAIVLNDYGDAGLDALLETINVISTFYRYIPLNDQYQLTFYKRLSDEHKLAVMFPNDYIEVSDFSTFALNSAKKYLVEVISENKVHVVIDQKLNEDQIRENAVVYQFNLGKEVVFGKVGSENLDEWPGVTSYFAMPTYKRLEEALEHFKIYVARKSNCDKIKSTWFTKNKIFFNRAPEDNLKKSLHQFLSTNVRGEVKEEQNVDDSKPVDIKITFDFSSHIALIEVKWLGKSIEVLGQKKPHQTMTDADAIAGANQLANYLELHKPYTPTLVTKGYLVVFDGRRWQTNTNTTDINRKDGFHYENKEITYTPPHHAIRDDFAKPVRFFMEPEVTLS